MAAAESTSAAEVAIFALRPTDMRRLSTERHRCVSGSCTSTPPLRGTKAPSYGTAAGVAGGLPAWAQARSVNARIPSVLGQYGHAGKLPARPGLGQASSPRDPPFICTKTFNVRARYADTFLLTALAVSPGKER